MLDEIRKGREEHLNIMKEMLPGKRQVEVPNILTNVFQKHGFNCNLFTSSHHCRDKNDGLHLSVGNRTTHTIREVATNITTMPVPRCFIRNFSFCSHNGRQGKYKQYISQVSSPATAQTGMMCKLFNH
jgi:hypothetical protein